MDPYKYFQNWSYVILKAHWPALGVVSAYPIDKARTEKLRNKWVSNTPRYGELKTIFSNPKKKDIKNHPDYQEWRLLQKARIKKQISRHKYHLSKNIKYDFHEGDIFHLREAPKQGIQILAVTSSVTYLTFVTGKSSSKPKQLDISDFASLLETGIKPIKAPIDSSFESHQQTVLEM